MTESEWSELELLLATIPGKFRPLPVDGMHGFLTALVLTGENWPVEPLLPSLLDSANASTSSPADLASLTQIPGITAWLHTMLDCIDAQLDDPDYLFSPMVRIYPRRGEAFADGRPWCAGFLLGMNHARIQWSEFLALPGLEARMWPIYRLGLACEEIHADLDHAICRARLEKPLSALQCEALTEQLPETLDGLAEQITDHRIKEAMAAMESGEEELAWRSSAPCPCGSGREFVQCCGVQRVLH
ncbi:UPF0149 family protein [Thauera aromatica]|nr:UPF0149 family protein [Thauera aromatica]MCK2127814.1 UPF0149 family protein [Thauera aromatica]